MRRSLLLVVTFLVLLVIGGCGSLSPDAPTGLTVTTTAPVTLSWNTVIGAASYKIYRSTISGSLSTKTVLVSDVYATTYKDATTLAGTTYYYQVTAVNSDGESSASSEVNVIAQAQTGGTFVLGGTVANSSVALNWSNISGAVSYNVYRSTSSSIITSKIKISTGLGASTFSDSSVVTGNAYFYQVTAVDATGVEFQVSNEFNITY